MSIRLRGGTSKEVEKMGDEFKTSGIKSSPTAPLHSRVTLLENSFSQENSLGVRGGKFLRVGHII